VVMRSKDSGRITHTFFVSGWMAGNAILCLDTGHEVGCRSHVWSCA